LVAVSTPVPADEQISGILQPVDPPPRFDGARYSASSENASDGGIVALGLLPPEVIAALVAAGLIAAAEETGRQFVLNPEPDSLPPGQTVSDTANTEQVPDRADEPADVQNGPAGSDLTVSDDGTRPATPLAPGADGPVITDDAAPLAEAGAPLPADGAIPLLGGANDDADAPERD
jgi:hypothetical protein